MGIFADTAMGKELSLKKTDSVERSCEKNKTKINRYLQGLPLITITILFYVEGDVLITGGSKRHRIS